MLFTAVSPESRAVKEQSHPLPVGPLRTPQLRKAAGTHLVWPHLGRPWTGLAWEEQSTERPSWVKAPVFLGSLLSQLSVVYCTPVTVQKGKESEEA